MKKIAVLSRHLALLATLFVSRSALAQDQKAIADALDWKTTKTCDTKTDLCHGYYDEPPIVKNTPNPPPVKKVPVEITAKGPIIFRENGTSVLQDDVVITQPGRRIHADTATLYRDQAGKISLIVLKGNVRAQENGKLLVGDTGTYDLDKKLFTLNGAIYHIIGIHELAVLKTPLDAWGTAKTATRDANGVLDLHQATYTTCSPLDPTWQLSASEMKLDKEKGVGTARNLCIKFKKVPVFYAPYYSFPLNKERKSGFLTPTFGSSSNFGYFVGEPYYFNLAPNYDLLVTPGWYTERGLQISENFRYLTPSSSGFLYASILADDKMFGTFRENTLASYAGTTPSADLAPYLSELENASNQRGYFDFESHTRINKEWSSKVFLRYVTDSYYNQDFQSQYLSQNSNQLPSFGELNYQGIHWDQTFLVQGYETLHPITQFNTPAQNQNSRLPEWDFGAEYPQISEHSNLSISGQFVNFDYHSSYSPFTYQMPIGQRVHLAPSISTPFNWASFYITPQLTTDNTDYVAQLATTADNIPRQNYEGTRTLPIIDIDSGWYFDHTTSIGKSSYIQTLEPRLFYLYTPYLNQNAYPNFDTQLLPFSTANFYSLNEFTGFDRLQNANQLTTAVTSHILRGIDASNLLTAEAGFITYFEPQKVLINPSYVTSTEHLSPMTGSLTWNPNALWALTSQLAWDASLNQMNNAQVGTQYHFENNHVLIFNYQFTHGNPNTPVDSFGYSTNSSLITGGIVWPLSKQWSGFGYTYYDLTHQHAVTQYTGLSYETCCWSFRVIAQENYNGTTQVEGGQVDQNSSTKSFFIQLMLKGLGSAGNRSAQTMLISTLPGFTDPFGNGGKTHYGTYT